MSTLSSLSESFIARRTESVDAEKIAELVKRHTETIFGRTDVQDIIEHANLSITLVGVDSGEVLGHLSLSDYPRVKPLDQTNWEDWLHGNFGCPNSSPLNSLFISLFVAKEGFLQGAISELLRATFISIPLLHFIFLACPTDTDLGAALNSHLQPVPNNEEDPQIDLYISHRFEHFPMLYVRPAKVEDADDLMPIFSQHCSEVNEQYGEYFLAEMIESQDDDHKTIVAEESGRAIGFLSVTTTVDVDFLNTCYQLGPFHGLKRPTDADETYSVSTEGTKRGSTMTLISTSSKSMATESDGTVIEGSNSVSGSEMAPQDKTTSQHSLASAASQDAVNLKVTTGNKLAGDGSVHSLHSPSTSTHKLETAPTASVQNISTSATSVQNIPTSLSHKLSTTSTQKLLPTASTTSVQNIPTSSTHKLSTTSTQKLLPTASTTSVKLGDVPTSSTEKLEQKSSDDISNQSPASQVDEQETIEEVTENEEAPVIRPRKKEYILKGECTALAVQLFAIDDKFETRSIDLLPMIFKLFPDRDFLVLSQPHSFPEFPLLNHFTRVPPRVGTSVSQELYVIHKCGLLHSFSVHHATASDLPGIAQLSSDLSGSPEMMKDLQRYIEAKRDPLAEGATPISALVAECSGQIVGVAIMRDEEDMLYIRSHYNIEDFIYFDYHRPNEHAHLHHFILNPVFSSYAKHFIKECLRLSYKSCLYYPLYPDLKSEPGRPHSIITALSHMVPIKPRQQILYPESLEKNAPLDDVLKKNPPFALYHTNRKLTLEPKITINSRIVVVGASDTAISFLETLIYSPHLCFTNITLVSPHSFTSPPITPSHNPTPSPLPEWPVTSSTLCFTQEQYALLGLHTWINLVNQKMLAINRAAQYIIVDSAVYSSSLVHYDYLLLCTGTQYQIPNTLGIQSPPKCVFTVNNNHEAVHLFHWIKKKFSQKNLEDKMIIYGNNLDAYSIVQAMLDTGVAPNQIMLAHPNSEPVCPDPLVMKRIEEALESAGVKVIKDVSLKKLLVDEEENLVVGVQFLVLNDESEIAEYIFCKALVYMDEKHVDTQAFKAMNDAYLVFDRRLVISADHATNDPYIFAAGPLTKFSRRYRADDWTHANYNSHEVGQRLAQTILSKLDPTADSWAVDMQSMDSDLLPTYSQYKAVAAYLPGGYHYIYIYPPRTKQYKSSADPENLVEKLSSDTDNGYLCLQFNRYRRLDEIVALSRQPLTDASNFLNLYNIHEKYLNNLTERYEAGIIKDLFNFFRSPWACAVYHDRFTDFMLEIREHLRTLPINGNTEDSFENYVQKMVETDPHIDMRRHHQELLSLFHDSSLKQFIKKKLYQYLQYNAHHLTMYTKPDLF